MRIRRRFFLMNKIINVSNCLPIRTDKLANKSLKSLAKVIDSITSEYDVIWVGWIGDSVDDSINKNQIVKDFKKSYNFVPLFLSDDEIEKYYHGFCNSSLWPVLHYISVYSSYDETWYDASMAVCQKFADTILEQVHDGDIVWIHDYHLMLLPSLLRAKKPDLKIAFFLHTPFPSYELFRCHPNRRELLEGILGADLIGFQTFGYLRHFRSTVLRILDLESEVNMIPYNGRETSIDVFPIGINWKSLSNTMKTNEYKNYLKKYSDLYKNKKIVLSVEHLDYSKGIQRKMLSIEKYLEEYPSQRECTVFIIIAMPSRGVEMNEFNHFQHDIEHAVGRINGKFSSLSNIPIHFISHNIKFSELCALYSISNVALVSPLMDGMNLIAKEYVACQKDNVGALLLSEFAGAAQELFNAIMINPYNINEVTKSIHFALNMSLEEKNKMILPMQNRIIKYDSNFWAKQFLLALHKATEKTTWLENDKKLDNSLVSLFTNKKLKKALFLDYDGTLREFVNDPDAAVPGEDLIEIFNRFNSRKDLDVYIVSGRKMDFIQKHMGHYSFTLIGEHGYFSKEPNKELNVIIPGIDLSWKNVIVEIFNLHTLSTPGSFVEEKTSSVVWHYRKADPEFGKWKAGQLIGDLTETISNLPVKIHHGKMIVEVSSQHVNKGLAINFFIKQNNYDLILCAGDDKTDEAMFVPKDDKIKTVKIGRDETKAEYRVSSPNKFRMFLKKLI